MTELDLSHVRTDIARTVRVLLEGVLAHQGENVHSLHVVGSALTADFIPGVSDVNTLVVLRELHLDFLDFLARLGKKYGKKGLHSPLIMTPGYIERSLDVFPVELLELKLIHECVYGEDVLEGLQIDKRNLRLQVERELKGALINLRQGYIAALRRKKLIQDLLLSSLSGCLPVFRAVLFLKDLEPPRDKATAVEALDVATEIDLSAFKTVLQIKRGEAKASTHECVEIFAEYYSALEALTRTVDALET